MEEVAASDRKAIVFSQWVEPLIVLADALRHNGALQYHGRIPQNQRTPILDRFKNDPDAHVLLMSYGTGSVGLNLQFTNYVFLFDRWWNPAIEDQAINRAPARSAAPGHRHALLERRHHRTAHRGHPRSEAPALQRPDLAGRQARIPRLDRRRNLRAIRHHGPPEAARSTEKSEERMCAKRHKSNKRRQKRRVFIRRLQSR